jgi:CDP-diacylglycerol--inositol 3-phosphatidyltransferase
MYSLYLGVQKHESWEPVVYLYFFAFALDAVDGYVARLVGQSSSFGAVLDMVTDRTATAGLVMLNLLVEEDEMRKFGWITLVMLDIGSHWFHCISAKGHHKSDDANKNKNIFLRLYYGCLPLFFACCIGQEAFYLLNFIKAKGGNYVFGEIEFPSWLHHEMWKYFPVNVLEILWQITLVLGAIKQVVNVAQLASAAAALAEDDAEARKKKK